MTRRLMRESRQGRQAHRPEDQIHSSHTAPAPRKKSGPFSSQTYLTTRHTNRSSFFQSPSFNAHTHNDWITSIEDKLKNKNNTNPIKILLFFLLKSYRKDTVWEIWNGNKQNCKKNGFYLRKDFQSARENSNVFKFVSFLGFQFIAISHELIKEMVNDISLELRINAMD